MRRLLILIVAITAACGAEPAAEPANLAYVYEVGETVSFEYEVTQGLVGTVNLADTPGFFGDTEVPSEFDIAVASKGILTYTVNPSDSVGTFEIAVTNLVEESSVTGTVDGEPVEDAADLPGDIAPEALPDGIVLIVRPSGEAEPRDAAPTDLFGLIADPMSAAAIGGLNPLADHLGPVFPTEPVEAGATWETVTEQEVLGTSVTTTFAHELESLAEVDEVLTATIRTALDGSGFELSLGELLSLFFGGSNDLADGADTGSITGAGLDLTISVDPIAGQTITEFDVVTGRTLSYRVTSRSPASLSLSFPDEETGEPISGSMALTTSLDFEALLVDGV